MTHWQQGGYTTIKTDTGQYTFKGTSPQEIDNHIKDLKSKRARIGRNLRALKMFKVGKTTSNPDAMR